MSLVHNFAIIPNCSDIIIVSDNIKSVAVSDILIQYIRDSLNWIRSSWNGNEKRDNISYYGYSVIESQEIKKLVNILCQWKSLFLLAPEHFSITGNYLEEEKTYEKILICKNDLIKELQDWIDLCEEAIYKKSCMLHNGI